MPSAILAEGILSFLNKTFFNLPNTLSLEAVIVAALT
jgi:hypothetical protein